MIDLENEEQLPLEERFRLHARRLQLWRLCRRAACHRVRACRGDPRRCGVRLAEWAEAVRMAATQELNARDPERRAMIDDLQERFLRLGKAMTDGA